MEGLHLKTSIKDDSQDCFLLLEGDLTFEDVIGPNSLKNLTRKEFLVRLKDVFGYSNEEHTLLKRVHKASGATIAVISTLEVKFHLHARMELWGTAAQIEIAESEIKREITKLYYQGSSVPTILMKAPIYHHEVYIPISHVSIELLGLTFKNLGKIEAQSGAWLLVDPLGISAPHIPMRRVNIFGKRDQVYRALMIVNKAVLEPYKPEPSGTLQAADEHKDCSNVLGAGPDFTLTEAGTSTMVNSSATLQSSFSHGPMVPAVDSIAPFVIQPPTPQVSTVSPVQSDVVVSESLVEIPATYLSSNVTQQPQPKVLPDQTLEDNSVVTKENT